MFVLYSVCNNTNRWPKPAVSFVRISQHYSFWFGLFIKGAISVLLPQLGSVCMSKNSPACCIYLRPERRCWGSDSSVCCTVLLHAQQLKSIERTRKRIAYCVANLIWTQTIGWHDDYTRHFHFGRHNWMRRWKDYRDHYLLRCFKLAFSKLLPENLTDLIQQLCKVSE